MPLDPLVRAFDGLVRRHPRRILIASTRHSCRVAGVDTLAREVENVLRDLRLAPGTLVGVSSPNGPAFLALLLACRRAGVVAVLLESRATSHEVSRVANRLGAALALRYRNAWPGSRERVEVIGTEESSPRRGVEVARSDAAVIKLTSGTTGQPRGIATSMEALLADDEALVATMGIREQDRLLATVPFSHSYGLSSLVMPALARGIRLIVPDGTDAFAPLKAAHDVEATVFPTVPAYLAGLLRVSEPPPLPASLRLILSAGAPLLPATAARFHDVFGRHVHVFYGASECGGITYDREGTAARRGTLGTPVQGVRVDLEGNTGDFDGAGRVVVSSPAVATTYLPEPDDALRDGRFRTGDLGVLAGDELKLVGRLNRLINVKGKKVNPVEIEDVISELTPVSDVVVCGVARPGSGDELIRAVVACPPATLTVEQVIAACRGKLSDFKVPRSVILVGTIPRNDRGKVAWSAFTEWTLDPSRSSGPRA